MVGELVQVEGPNTIKPRKRFQMIRNIINRITGKDESSEPTGTAAAAAEQKEMFGFLIPIVEAPGGSKDLIQVHTWTPSEKVLAAPAQFYCINMDEGVDEAIRWVRETRHVAPFEKRRVPVIYVIGPGRPLYPEELQAVNNELAPTGAYFFKRPDYRASFHVAMRALRDELARQFGSSATLNSWRKKQREPVTTP